jgi:hypothetical protein
VVKVNLKMADGSELKEVNIFRTKELSDSIITDYNELEEVLKTNQPKSLWFSGKYVQGSIIPQRILSYKIIDESEELEDKLREFISETNTIWDINYSDVAGYMVENKEALAKILSK